MTLSSVTIHKLPLLNVVDAAGVMQVAFGRAFGARRDVPLPHAKPAVGPAFVDPRCLRFESKCKSKSVGTPRRNQHGLVPLRQIFGAAVAPRLGLEVREDGPYPHFSAVEGD